MTFVSASGTSPNAGESVLSLPRLTVGIDLGDRVSDLCIIDTAGEILKRFKVKTRHEDLDSAFAAMQPSRIVMEVGTHSPWVSRLAASHGHQVVVANARKVKLISQGTRKNDRRDAELLARLGRTDIDLLSPIKHVGAETQFLRLKLRQRAALVRQRAALVNHVRGSVKSLGFRVEICSSASFTKRARRELPPHLVEELSLMLSSIDAHSRSIKELDNAIEDPPASIKIVVDRLRQIPGVGPILSLTFVLTIEDPRRFSRSRDIGPYLGLVPKQDQSGRTNKQLRISKAGDAALRSLLVNASHHILQRGPTTRLKDFGIRLIERGGSAPRKRAAVAVARKLAMVMLRMWLAESDYVR